MSEQELEGNVAIYAAEHNIPVERCCPIPKEELVEGMEYSGNCRNADKAVWKNGEFTYIRHKFYDTFPETINHYEDDDGYDVFVPIKITEE